MLRFDTGQPRLPKLSRKWLYQVTGDSAPSGLTTAGAGVTFTTRSGLGGLGGITASITSAPSNVTATISGEPVNVSGAAYARIRAKFDTGTGSDSVLVLEALNESGNRGFGVGRYNTASANVQARVRTATEDRYVQTWATPFAASKDIDISILIDIAGKTLYLMEGEQIVDMWDASAYNFLYGTPVLIPRLRLASSSSASAGTKTATLRELSTEVFYSVDPGLLPILPPTPPSLYSLSANDYLYRFEASALSGSDGSTLNSWTDSMEGLVLTSANSDKVLHSPGASAYVTVPPLVSSGIVNSAIDLGGDKTVMMLVNRSNTVENNFLRLDNWLFGLSGSSLSLTGTGTVTGPSSQVPIDTWTVIFAAVSSTSPTNSRAQANNLAQVGPGTITAANSGEADRFGIIRGATQPGDLKIASMVVWQRMLSKAEMDAVYAAVVSGSPLI